MQLSSNHIPVRFCLLAITVSVCQEVLEEAGFNTNVVTLAADTAEHPITAELS